MNQSTLRPEQQQQIELQHEHDGIFNRVQDYLVQFYQIPRTASIFQEYSHQLLNYFYQSYSAPVSYKDRTLAQQQAQIVTSIRKKIRQHHLVIRLTDKGHHFYIGLEKEFHRKAEKFFSETNAYVEVAENPLDELLNKVIQLLNTCYSKHLVLKWQYEKMMPDRSKCELSHLYFNPKTHKVI